MSPDLLTADRQRHDAAIRAFEERVATVVGVRNAADAALVAVTVEALDAALWEGWRIHTPVQWLVWRTGVARSTATRVVALARRAAELPTVMRLLSEGRLSLDQAHTIARYTPAEFEASVSELALNASVPQIVAATREYSFDVEQAERDAAAADRGRRAGPERSVEFGTESSDQWWAKVRLPLDEGKVVEEALDSVRHRLHGAERAAAQRLAADEGRPTTGSDADLGVPAVTNADALVGLATAALATDATGAEVGLRPGVLLHLERPQAGCGEQWRAEMHMGPTLPDHLRRYLLCDCDIEVVWTEEGIPVATARNQRIVPRRIRRLIERRDRGCRVPGCDRQVHLQAHHIVHWEDDGETITANLVCLCSHHHRLHHQGHLAIEGNADSRPGDPDVLTFTDRHGVALAPAGSPRVPTADDMPTVDPYTGPTGDTLRKKWICFNRSRPPDHPAAISTT